MGSKRQKNVIYRLCNRERGVLSNLRNDLKILNNLVCCAKNKYRKIWEKHSKKPIAYEGGKLYMDNYRSCYTINGRHGLPQLMYKLRPNCTVSEKIEEAVICQAPVYLSDALLEDKNYRGSFLALTANNYLIRYDMDTGQQLQVIYLSSMYKFRHLSWDCDGHTVCLKSTHSKITALAREAGITRTLLMSLAVFSVFPLQFIGMMEVTKQIFGHDITDSMISQGIVIIMHQSGFVRLYSFDHILRMGKFESRSSMSLNPAWYNEGPSLNIKLKECPPLLFEVKCSDHSLYLGGIPWHYIITPPGSRGYFKVYSLDNKQLAEGGYLDLETLSIEPDKCLFHPDDSGKILHVGSRQLQVYSLTTVDSPLKSEGSPKSKLKELYTIEPFRTKSQEDSNTIRYTSSGREIKKSISYTEDMVDISYENIATVDYENDLDILFMAVVSQGREGLEGSVHLYDNDRGHLVKEVTLEETWKEFHEHVISLDLDTLVHIVKAPMRQYSCYVYQLQRQDDFSDQTQCLHGETQGLTSSGGTRTNRTTQARRNRRNRATVNYDDT